MDFLTHITAASAPATVRTYESLYRNHMKGFLETHSIQQLVIDWLAKELSPRTIRKLFTIYRAWYEFTYDKHPKGINTLIAKIGRLERNDPKKVWSKDDCNKVLRTAFILNKELHDRILFTLNIGCRRSEMESVRTSDIDYKNKKIKIIGHKTGLIRFVPFTDKLLPIFPKEEGLIFTKIDLNKQLRKICEAAGVEVLTWHGLRHTFATLLLEAGISPKKVAKILGHKKAATTINIYWHLFDESIDLSALPGD